MSTQPISHISQALPFWVSLGLIPAVILAAIFGGWFILLVPLYTWGLFTLLDLVSGTAPANPNAETPDSDLNWYRLITLIWAPLEAATLFGTLAYITQTNHLAWWELIGVAFGLGVLTGTIGIVYAHELMHRQSRIERWLGDILMAMALYGHFRSEHLLVHHRYVGTPRDPVTARYNENFHRFFLRILPACLLSAWNAEAARLTKRGRPIWHHTNPFWRYAALQLACLLLAYLVGGVLGVALFVYAAFIAMWQLELVNYVEHYGLTRKHLGEGKYEHAQLHHSWNSDHKTTNWLLINLQRHADHHMHPNRRFPLLQTQDETLAPQLPYGYSAMTTLALFPGLWRKSMNPRVQDWRKQHYPEINDWSAYNSGANPMPR